MRLTFYNNNFSLKDEITMKKIITSAVCSSLLLLTACSDNTQSTETAKKEMPVMQKTALASGIDKATKELSLRPQDNFYRYVNGAWLNANEIPGDKTSIGAFYDLRDEADENVKVIIEELAATENLKMGSDEQKVADLFRSYMNTDARNAAGTTPIQPLFDSINGLKDKNELATFFGKNQQNGVGSPLAFYISVDAKDSTRYATHIWQSGLGLPDKDYYFDEKERFAELRKGYVAHIENMFNLAGLKNGKADLNNDNKIMIGEISKFIRKEVYELTNGMQKSTNRAEVLDVDWRLW